MTVADDNSAFGVASDCTSLSDAIEQIKAFRFSLMRGIRLSDALSMRRSAAAYGMALQASQAVRATYYFDDTLFVLGQLSHAKAEIDIAARHDCGVAAITSAILAAAQEFVDQETIGCHEWPKPQEVADVALRVARERAGAGG
jgi:hypothetical protein